MKFFLYVFKNKWGKIVSTGLLGMFVFFFSVKFFASADAPITQVTGCLSTNAGLFYNLKTGSSPLNPCPTGDPQIMTGTGDITSVIAETGLTGGGTEGEVTLGIANGGVTATQLADGAVSPDKISNSASESSRIYSGGDDDDHTVSALNQPPALVIPTSITVTVPAGKAYNYIAVYDGTFSYLYSERNGGSTSLFASWDAALLANDTNISIYSTPIVRTGYSSDWSATGGNSYWAFPYNATWIIRLTEGTYTFKINLYNGYSNNTMTTAHFGRQRLQVIRVF